MSLAKKPVGRNQDLENSLSKKSTWTFNERVIKTGLITIDLDPEQRKVFSKHISIDNHSISNLRKTSHIIRLFEIYDIPLRTNEIKYIFAAMDFISYVLRVPKYSEVLMSYGILAVALAIGDSKHLDEDITKHCKYHDTLRKIASHLLNSSFVERYSIIKGYAIQLAEVDVSSLYLEEKLEKSMKLQEYISVRKDLHKFQAAVEDYISEIDIAPLNLEKSMRFGIDIAAVEGSISKITSEPLIECLKECNINITNMLQKSEILMYIALLQHLAIQAILSNPFYKTEIQKAITANKSDDNSPLIEKIYRMPALGHIRQDLKNISPDGSLNGTMVKEIIDKACSIKKRERIIERKNIQTNWGPST